MWKLWVWRKDHKLYKNNPNFNGERDIIEFLADDCLELTIPVSRPSVSNDHSYYSINRKDSEEADHTYFIEEVPCFICDLKIQSNKTKSHNDTHKIFYCIKCKKMFITEDFTMLTMSWSSTKSMLLGLEARKFYQNPKKG